MKRVIYKRLLAIIESSNGVTVRQYRFGSPHFAVNSISMGVDLGKDALCSDGSCAVLAVDTKNIFNSDDWDRIKEVLTDIDVSEYFTSLVQN